MEASAAKPPWTRRRPALFFLGTNLVYLLLVHAPAFYYWPGHAAELLPHLGALYLCMVAVFFLTRVSLDGHWWLCSLASASFLANPLKTEAIFSSDGLYMLLMSAAAIGSVACYGAWRRSGWHTLLAPTVFLFCIPTLWSTLGLGLLPVVLLWEWLIMPNARRPWPVLCLLLIIALAGTCLHAAVFSGFSTQPAQLFAPLALVLYPIGLLPQNAARAVDLPWLTLACAGFALWVLYLIHRKARHPVLVFAIGSALATRALQLHWDVDLVSLKGGSVLLPVIAWAGVGVAALCQRMQQHPKWRKPVVFLTTLWCIVLFSLQVRSIVQWAHAAGQTG
jgi:hypothetical protein